VQVPQAVELVRVDGHVHELAPEIRFVLV
jgi:hypothetical protein